MPTPRIDCQENKALFPCSQPRWPTEVLRTSETLVSPKRGSIEALPSLTDSFELASCRASKRSNTPTSTSERKQRIERTVTGKMFRFVLSVVDGSTSVMCFSNTSGTTESGRSLLCLLFIRRFRVGGSYFNSLSWYLVI